MVDHTSDSVATSVSSWDAIDAAPSSISKPSTSANIKYSKPIATKKKLPVVKGKLHAAKKNIAPSKGKLPVSKEKLTITKKKLPVVKRKLPVAKEKLPVAKDKIVVAIKKRPSTKKKTTNDKVKACNKNPSKSIESELVNRENQFSTNANYNAPSGDSNTYSPCNRLRKNTLEGDKQNKTTFNVNILLLFLFYNMINSYILTYSHNLYSFIANER